MVKKKKHSDTDHFASQSRSRTPRKKKKVKRRCPSKASYGKCKKKRKASPAITKKALQTKSQESYERRFRRRNIDDLWYT